MVFNCSSIAAISFRTACASAFFSAIAFFWDGGTGVQPAPCREREQRASAPTSGISSLMRINDGARAPREAPCSVYGAPQGSPSRAAVECHVVPDAVRKRFAKTAEAVAELQDRRAEETREHVARLLTLTGEERALDVGTGAGAFALALAPLVREVVGVDIVPELLAEAGKRATENSQVLEADAEELPFPPRS